MNPREILPLLRTHLELFIAHAPIGRHGPAGAAMWLSSINLATGEPIWTQQRPPGVSKRCYRLIESPGGSNAYWDAPLLTACMATSRATGDGQFAAAAEAYIRDFLRLCVAPTGLFLWGNHYYFDARRGCVVKFQAYEDHAVAIDPATERGEYHETRPLSVPWQLFWSVDSHKTQQCLLAQAQMHVVDAETGEFNRHADNTSEHAFLESGGILAEGLCWLYEKTADAAALETARRVAEFSYSHRDANTGLLSNSPMLDRWDMHQCTSEIGMWAGCMLRCHRRSGAASFADLACSALAAWLRWAWDDAAGGFYGKLRIHDGSPVTGDKVTEYQPGDHCDPWQPLFPAHDYPMQAAQACVEAWKLTGERAFADGIRRWLSVLHRSLPARGGLGGYAEHYARAIWFLLSAAEALGDAAARQLAHRVADEAVTVLRCGDRLRSHPLEDRCDAVDGIGLLILALLRLGGAQADTLGMGW